MSLPASVRGRDQVKSNMSEEWHGHNELPSVLKQGCGKIRCIYNRHQQTWKRGIKCFIPTGFKKGFFFFVYFLTGETDLVASSWQTSQPQPKLTWFVVGVIVSHQVLGVGGVQAQEAGLVLKRRIALCFNDPKHKQNVWKTVRKSSLRGDLYVSSLIYSQWSFRGLFPDKMKTWRRWSVKVQPQGLSQEYKRLAHSYEMFLAWWKFI